MSFSADQKRPSKHSRSSIATRCAVVAVVGIGGSVAVVFLSVGLWLSSMGFAVPGTSNGRPWTAWFVALGLAAVLLPPFVGGAIWGWGTARIFDRPARSAARTGALAFGGMVILTAAPTDLTQLWLDDLPAWMPLDVHGYFTIVFMGEVGIVACLATWRLANASAPGSRACQSASGPVRPPPRGFSSARSSQSSLASASFRGCDCPWSGRFSPPCPSPLAPLAPSSGSECGTNSNIPLQPLRPPDAVHFTLSAGRPKRHFDGQTVSAGAALHSPSWPTTVRDQRVAVMATGPVSSKSNPAMNWRSRTDRRNAVVGTVLTVRTVDTITPSRATRAFWIAAVGTQLILAG